MGLAARWLGIPVLALGVTTVIAAAGQNADKCEAGKNREAGKYAFCRQKVEAKHALKPDDAARLASLQKCSDKYDVKWVILEQKAATAGDPCPSLGDQAPLLAKTASHTNAVAAVVAGTRFEDNGDGTVTDHLTGLQWEQKRNLDGSTNYGDPHDADNWGYTWVATSGTPPSGSLFVQFLDQLNGGLGPNTCFTGHCDWRLPTIEELAGIVDLGVAGCGSGTPCIDPVFGPTEATYNAGVYASATTRADNPGAVWIVTFWNGATASLGKHSAFHARAVRAAP